MLSGQRLAVSAHFSLHSSLSFRVQSYKKYFNYANILAIILQKYRKFLSRILAIILQKYRKFLSRISAIILQLLFADNTLPLLPDTDGLSAIKGGVSTAIVVRNMTAENRDSRKVGKRTFVILRCDFSREGGREIL